MREPGGVAGGRYMPEERIGRGGMSEVFRGTDRVLQRPVAVKVLADHLLDDRAAVERFRREARTVATLTDPAIVAVHDAVTEPDLHAIVLELVDGPTLADRLRDEAPLPRADAVEIARQVAAALETAHAKGLVHRDVKPSNILFADGDRVKVTDFGIAGIVEATTTVSLHGSAPYLAPEQADGGAPDPRTDVYAVGCLLMEMLTGRPPFEGQTTAELVNQHLHASPPAPSDRVPDLGRDVDAVVGRCLEKDPAARYASMSSLRQDLERLRDRAALDELEATTPLPTPEPSEAAESQRGGLLRRVGLVAALLTVTATAGVATATMLDDDRPEPEALVSLSPAAAEPSPVTTPAPSPSTDAESPLTSAPSTAVASDSTPVDAVRLVRSMLAEGRLAGEVTAKRVDEIERRLTEVLAKLEEGKVDDARKKLDEARKKLDEGLDELEISEPLHSRITERLDALEDLLT